MTWLNQYAHTHHTRANGTTGAASGHEMSNDPHCGNTAIGRSVIIGNRRIVGAHVGGPPHGHGGHGGGHGHGGHGHHGHGHGHHGHGGHVYSPGGPYPAYYGYDPYYYEPEEVVYVLDPTAYVPQELGTRTRTRMGT
jgi:hypothetical protein